MQSWKARGALDLQILFIPFHLKTAWAFVYMEYSMGENNLHLHCALKVEL